MSPSPEALVLMLDAMVSGDEQSALTMRSSTRRCPLMAEITADLTYHDSQRIRNVERMTNHFSLR